MGGEGVWLRNEGDGERGDRGAAPISKHARQSRPWSVCYPYASRPIRKPACPADLAVEIR